MEDGANDEHQKFLFEQIPSRKLYTLHSCKDNSLENEDALSLGHFENSNEQQRFHKQNKQSDQGFELKGNGKSQLCKETLGSQPN